MGAKTVEEIVASVLERRPVETFGVECIVSGIVNDLRAAGLLLEPDFARALASSDAAVSLRHLWRTQGLLLEPGQRERIYELRDFADGMRENAADVIEDFTTLVGRFDALLRELAGAGEPGHVGAPSSQERATGEDRAEGTAGTSSQPSSRPHEPAPTVANAGTAAEERFRQSAAYRTAFYEACGEEPEPAPVVDEPAPPVVRVSGAIPTDPGQAAPPASAPRRMARNTRMEAWSLHARAHDENDDCATEPCCHPVELPKVRRMRGNPEGLLDPDHCGEHDERDDCAAYPACQPVAPSSAFPEHKCVFETQPPNDTRVYCDCCGTPAPVQHVCVNGLARAWAKEGCKTCAKPSSTKAAGPSPDPHATCCPTVRWMTGQGAPWHAMQPHHERETCASAGCSQVATSQPPHVHQWAAVTRVVEASDHEMLGEQYVVTVWVERVTREHCVADGCTEPPAVREVSS